MTSPTTASIRQPLSYSVRVCGRCSAQVERTQGRFGRSVWKCPSCGKRARS